MSKAADRLAGMARYVRIFDLEPSDDVIRDCAGVITEIRSRLLKRKSASGLFAFMDGICRFFDDCVVVSEALSTQVEDVIKKRRSSYLHSHGDLEAAVCGTAAVFDAITRGPATKRWLVWSAADVFASSLWSALSFLPRASNRRLEALRRQTVDAARCRHLESSVSARTRYDIPRFNEMDCEGWSAGIACKRLKELQFNAVLDREEIGVLRWVQADESEILGSSLKLLPEEIRAVVAGVELGMIMRAPPAQFHRDLCGRGLEQGPYHDLVQLVGQLGNHSASLVASCGDASLVEAAPSVFPILSALLYDDLKRPGAGVRRAVV